MSNAKALIEYLKKSPVFASSLGSKELFHSNIWAYLIEQNAKFLEVFFPNEFDSTSDIITKDEKTGEKAHREKFNMDLLVVTTNKVFVIENKIKSLPHEDQLKKYEDIIDEKYKKKKKRVFLLTGIRENKPSIVEKSDWDYLNYDKIAERIKEKLKGCEQENYYAFASEYCDMMVKLSSLLKSGIKEIKSKYYFPTCIDEFTEKELLKGIEQLRVGDIFQKLNSERFVQHVQKEIGSQFSENPKGNSGYTHQHSLAEFFFERTGKPESEKDITPHVRIGVQIQEAQFRWYIVTRTKKAKDADDVFKLGLSEDLKWFFEHSDEAYINCPTGCECATRMRKGKKYCLFHTSTDTFVYQYTTIDKDKCDFGTLTGMVIEFLKCADGKIDTIKNEFLS